uniref:CAF17 C-terminal domain-containing protein n=1 Tax=Neobodo designis TaxID=312471 RepID=A0A7S1M486_NEODS|mmetsp:Transcript_34037/g.105103  ORF Transcript_34037/g.105103 Transcript_34037/m.105103 type:complete len:322 (+) Transcript_34037:41-1006(+)
MPSPALPLTHLRNRGVLQLSGRDTYNFLHAMSTCNAKSMARDALAYCGFLNSKGRMLFDAVLHPVADATEPTVMIEMDRSEIPGAIEHFKEYKLRTKVKFADRSDELAVIVGASPPFGHQSAGEVLRPDPRPPVANVLGIRRGLLPEAELKADAVSEDMHAYRDELFSLGVADGADVFTPGKSIPFDGNLDGVEGVSFHKGCYVGQELTHRTHVMLVVRKRLVPFELVDAPPSGVDAADLAGKGVTSSAHAGSCGRITAWGVKHGVGLFRLANFLDEGAVFSVGDLRVKPSIPEWWPDEFMQKIREEHAAKAPGVKAPAAE